MGFHTTLLLLLNINYFKPPTLLPFINLKKTKDRVALVVSVSVKVCFALAKNGTRALAPFCCTI